MPLFANNIIVGQTVKEGPKVPPAPENSWNNLHHKLDQLAKEAERERKKAEKAAAQVTRNVPFQEPVEEKNHYEIVKHGDLVKHHNTKSHYLNDMTGFEN